MSPHRFLFAFLSCCCCCCCFPLAVFIRLPLKSQPNPPFIPLAKIVCLGICMFFAHAPPWLTTRAGALSLLEVNAYLLSVFAPWARFRSVLVLLFLLPTLAFFARMELLISLPFALLPCAAENGKSLSLQKPSAPKIRLPFGAAECARLTTQSAWLTFYFPSPSAS